MKVPEVLLAVGIIKEIGHAPAPVGEVFQLTSAAPAARFARVTDNLCSVVLLTTYSLSCTVPLLSLPSRGCVFILGFEAGNRWEPTRQKYISRVEFPAAGEACEAIF